MLIQLHVVPGVLRGGSPAQISDNNRFRLSRKAVQMLERGVKLPQAGDVIRCGSRTGTLACRTLDPPASRSESMANGAYAGFVSGVGSAPELHACRAVGVPAAEELQSPWPHTWLSFQGRSGDVQLSVQS